MTPYEIMLSESQERMLLVVKQGAEERVGRIFARWGLDVMWLAAGPNKSPK